MFLKIYLLSRTVLKSTTREEKEKKTNERGCKNVKWAVNIKAAKQIAKGKLIDAINTIA